MDKHALSFIVIGIVAVLSLLRYLIPWVYHKLTDPKEEESLKPHTSQTDLDNFEEEDIEEEYQPSLWIPIITVLGFTLTGILIFLLVFFFERLDSLFIAILGILIVVTPVLSYKIFKHDRRAIIAAIVLMSLELITLMFYAISPRSGGDSAFLFIPSAIILAFILGLGKELTRIPRKK